MDEFLARNPYKIARLTLNKLTRYGLVTVAALTDEVYHKKSFAEKMHRVCSQKASTHSQKLTCDEIDALWNVSKAYLGLELKKDSNHNQNKNNHNRQKKQPALQDEMGEGTHVYETKGKKQQKQTVFI